MTISYRVIYSSKQHVFAIFGAPAVPSWAGPFVANESGNVAKLPLVSRILPLSQRRWHYLQLKMAESSFSSNDSKTFIYVAPDNRIHLWDTDTQRERRSYVEKHNLSHSYTCSSWKSGKKDNLGYFAVGASDGTVIIWDLTRGVVSKVIGRANETPVPSSIAFSNDTKSILVSSSSDSNVVQYDLSSGGQVNLYKAGKRGINKVSLNPKVDVLAAGG